MTIVAVVAGSLTLGATRLDAPDPLGASSSAGATGTLADTLGQERTSRSDRRRERRADAIAVADGGERLGVRPGDPPAAGLVFDLDTGEVLWSRDPHEQRPVASLTKIMTAVIAAEELRDPARKVTIGDQVEQTEGSAVGLERGMRVSVGALFQAALIASANDAATALAEASAGSERRFVRRMNRRARRLGLDCTRFVSPHGLEPANRSCAADMAALTRLAMGVSRIRRIVRKDRTVVDFPIPGGIRYLASTNPLLQTGYVGTIGMKTGYTPAAGRSLSAVVRRDGRTLGAVVLDSKEPGPLVESLLDATFEDRERDGRRVRDARRRKAADPAGRRTRGRAVAGARTAGRGVS
ncbi:MAG TPA: serine hydrolase, partial [Thermoleophilaceae bacterium]|nr:serine hydrolase [Thermoleophilaceae bacterium]